MRSDKAKNLDGAFKEYADKYEREMREAITQDLLNKGITKEQIELERAVVDIYFQNRSFTNKELFNHA